MTTTEQAGPRPGTETMTIIPGFRAAQIDLNAALTVMERLAYAVAKERDAAVREREEALQELGKLRARVEELETAVRKAQDDHCGCLGYIADVAE